MQAVWYFTSWNSQKQNGSNVNPAVQNIQILCEQSLVQDPMRLKSNSPCSLKDKAGPRRYQNVSNIIQDHLEFDLKMSQAMNQSSNQEIKQSNQKVYALKKAQIPIEKR